MRSLRFGMETVVCGLAVWASAWVGGEVATVETWSRDGHSGLPGVVTPSRHTMYGGDWRM